MAINALHLHFDEWAFVDSSGQNKLVTNNGVSVVGFELELLHINGSGTDLYSNPYLAQSVTPDSNWEVKTVFANHSVWSTTGYGKVEIRPDNGGQPDVNSSVLITSDVVNIGTVDGPSPNRFTFSSPYTLQSGVIYWIVFVSTDSGGSPSGNISWRRTGASVYADGYIAAGVTGNDTPWGVNTNYDMRQLKLLSDVISGAEFDGSSDLQIAKSNSLTVNNEDWEIYVVIRHSSLAGTQAYFSQYEDTNNRCHLQHINGTGLNFLFRYNGVDLISLTGTEITDSSEHHIALTKENDTFRLFLDGLLEDSATYSFGNELIDSDIFIGQDGNSASYFNGNMRKLRISNVARFVNIFSPDTNDEYETDENTQLLINFRNNINDSAEAGLSIWNPRQVTRGNVDTGLRIFRFGNQCAYFSGTQDGFSPYSLQLPDHPNWYIANRNFTLDTWLYPLSHFNYSGIMHQNTRWYWYIDSAGRLNFYIQSGSDTFSMQSSGTVPTNEWSHCALTRRLEDGNFFTFPAPAGYQSITTPTTIPTFDPAAKGINIVLSNGNLTATFPGFGDPGWNSVFGTNAALAGGKWYWEVNVDLRGHEMLIGIAQNNTNLIRFADDLTGYAYYSTGAKYSGSIGGWPGTAYGASYTSGDKIGIALDLINGKLFFAKNGLWQGGGDPVAGTGAAFTGLNLVPHYPAQGLYTAGGSSAAATIEFGGLKQVWRMYIKGIRQAQSEQDFTIPNLTGPLWIGRGTSDSDLYHGYMDELRLLLNKAVWTENEFWPFDYQYFDESIVHRYRRMHRRRIHSIQGR